ncbi:MAG: hypothetical protein CM15mP62_17450 [Rhodospirillaceae bacterium]|nr:MAG: hypothetical protein CM15mP62_17450 [Rhodospirillaceae bacterium]
MVTRSKKDFPHYVSVVADEDQSDNSNFVVQPVIVILSQKLDLHRKVTSCSYVN